MWVNLRSEVATRILAARTYFTAVAGPRGSSPAPPTPAHEVTAKGVMFVQLYAVYEHTVREIVRLAIAEIKNRATAHKDIRLELLSLALDSQLQSAAECAAESKWTKRMSLFSRVNSPEPLDVSDATFPHDGTNYRMGQLYTIWNIFGIVAPVIPSPRLTQRIGELVENRNAIAHGRRTAEDVGSAHSRDDIHDRIDAVNDICGHIITTMEQHCSNPANLSR